jgi:flagellar biosynthesis protein FlhG
MDPSWLQYIGQEFREFLKGSGGSGSFWGFHPDDIPLIGQIYERMAVTRESAEAVRQDLWRQRRRLKVVGVTSGKGGVGKTTISLNLAIAFAQQGRRVLLLDADLGMANVHVYAGVRPRGTILEVINGTRTLADSVAQGPGGIHILCGQSGIAGAADLEPRWIENLGSQLRRESGAYDVLLIDTGAGISTQVMSFLGFADEIVVIATPNLASTLDAYGVVKVIRETNIGGRVHLLINRAGSAQQAENLFVRIASCARQFLQFEPTSLGFLADDAGYEASSQNRTPLVLAEPSHEGARRFSELARQLVDHGPAVGKSQPPCSVTA